jgi:two-component system phosphate regulon sensor histidine kinase PhoR
MLRMVDNLLDISRLDSGQLDLQLQETNLVALIAQVLDQQQPIANKRELSLKNSFAELWVTCDSLRIRQVLTNLVGNAIKYSPPEAQIMVCLTITENFETEPEVVIAVTDKGNGIPIEQQGRLFERYYRAGNRRKAEGLGLGLYLSRHFVQMHGGRIWLESNDGQGSTFYFTLPMVR